MKRMPRPAGPDLDRVGLWLDDAGADGSPAAILHNHVKHLADVLCPLLLGYHPTLRLRQNARRDVYACGGTSENAMTKRQDIHEAPTELADAWARIDQAKENYYSLAREMNAFLYQYVKGMVKGFDRESGNFVIRLRHPKESNVTGTPRVLVAQIVENLRTALDYMIFELSVLNEPNLNERVTQFVIADSESDFERQAKRRLQHLTDEQKSFVEQIQPYHGNGMLALLRELAGLGQA